MEVGTLGRKIEKSEHLGDTKFRNTWETNTEVGTIRKHTHMDVETLGKHKHRCWNTWVINMKLGTLRRH
jgi:hypothetical protein